MASALKVLYQRENGNSKTLIVGVAVIGNYPGDPGEVVNLTAGLIPNPNAKTITGPNYSASALPSLPPKIGAEALGGYQAQLLPTAANIAGTAPGQYALSFWNGVAELGAGAYPAVISGGTLTLELEFDLQG
jgi:hypothetical protein